MPTFRRSAAAAALLIATALPAGMAALAQESSNTVGPTQLKDFQLPGQRTTPPASTPTPPAPPPPAATTPPPAERRTEPAPTPRAPGPAVTTPAPPPLGTAPEEDIIPPPEVETNLSAGPVEDALGAEANIVTPLPAPILPDAQLPPPLVPDEEAGDSWLVPAIGAGLALLLLGLGVVALQRRRRRREEMAVEEIRGAARQELGGALFSGQARPQPEPEPEPLPAPSPEPEVAAAVSAASDERRAWLEIDIQPERASATDTDASVQYALIIRNRGAAMARNIRIDAKLFNASEEEEVAAFFQGPIHEQSGSPHVTIGPDGRLSLMGQVAMPKAEAREIELAGQRIFVPMVAINVAYDWKDGSGRTSRSWIVGRESQATEKMGPFRLDLGPRIYRSVGRREAKLAMV